MGAKVDTTVVVERGEHLQMENATEILRVIETGANMAIVLGQGSSPASTMNLINRGIEARIA